VKKEAGSKKSLTLIHRQAWMKAVTGRQKLPGRGRQTGWQWQVQRDRLADSPQAGMKQEEAGRKAVEGREEEASRQASSQVDSYGGRQEQIGRGRQAG
jgi:hypothetical protein